jgi:hypothetical protein
VGLWLAATRTPRAERGRIALLSGLAVVPPAAALAMVPVGLDYLLYRNVLPALIPASMVLAAGFGARRAGAAGWTALAVLCTLSVGIVLATADEPKYGKEVWREVARALGPAPSGRAIVASPGSFAVRWPLAVYLPGTRLMPAAGAVVREVVVVGAAHRKLGALADPVTPRPLFAPPPPAPGLRLAARVNGDRFTLFRYRAARPLLVHPAQLARSRIARIETSVLLQP